VTDSSSPALSDTDTVEITINEPGNQPPSQPGKPSGPSCRHLLIPGTYTTSGSSDPEGDEIWYQFDWGGNYSAWLKSKQRIHFWTDEDDYDVKVRAKDEHGAMSSWSQHYDVFAGNREPTKPGTPNGPSSRGKGQSGTYETSGSIDPDGDTIYYKFDWGDGHQSIWLQSDERSHSWDQAGTYQVKVKAKDLFIDGESEWSDPFTVTVTDEPPTKPDAPSGPTQILRLVPHIYETDGSTDPDGDDSEIKYKFIWGDDSESIWLKSKSRIHFWTSAGEYDVTVLAKDEQGNISVESDELTVEVTTWL
jgi:hypothetical protein